jgi:flagellar assembly protein FliH
MPVIRNQQARHLTPRAIALEMADVHSEAAELLSSARTEVNELRARARAEAEDLRQGILEQARQEGERSGYEAGLERGRSEAMEQVLSEALEPHRELFEQLGPAWLEQVGRFAEERERLLEDSRRELLSFALEIARRVVQRTIEVDETVCIDQVAEALSLLGRPRTIHISISPDDRDVLERALPDLLEKAHLTEGVELVENDEIPRGGCLVSTVDGTVDARIETQLVRITQALLPGAER